MNPFVSTTFAADNTHLSEVLKLCKDNNITSLELGSNHSYAEDFVEIVRGFDFNYLVHNYFPIPKESFVLNIASLDDEINKMSLRHIKKAIDFCEKIDARLYTFHPGFLTDPKGSNISSNNYDFQWIEDRLDKRQYSKAYTRMLNAIEETVKYANSKNVKVAIESEGSVSKKDHLLMQSPEEYLRFTQEFGTEDIGINLNIGHLNLASNAFGFAKDEFISSIANYIVAMELSHNDGVEDQHLPLVANTWYWETIFDERFVDAYKILEFRNVQVNNLLENIDLFELSKNAH